MFILFSAKLSMIELLPVFNNTFLSGVVDYIYENMGFKKLETLLNNNGVG